MEIILFTFNAVAPLFVVIGVGYVLNRVGMIPDDTAGRLNKLCFLVLIPCTLFKTTYSAALSISYVWLIVYALLCYAVLIPLLCLIVPRFVPVRRQAGPVIQGIFRSNMVLIGIPLMTNLFGEEHTAPIALLITVVVPMFSVAGAIVLTFFSGEAGAPRPTVKRLLKNIFSNPLISAAALGVTLNLLNVPLPTVLYKPVADLGTIASPLAMIALGAKFSFGNFSSNRFAIIFGTVGRLVVIPLLMVTGGVLVGFRGDLLCALFICSATPTAVASVAMSDAMGCDGQLAGGIVVATSGLSCLTLFLELCLLQALGLM